MLGPKWACKPTWLIELVRQLPTGVLSARTPTGHVIGQLLCRERSYDSWPTHCLAGSLEKVTSFTIFRHDGRRASPFALPPCKISRRPVGPWQEQRQQLRRLPAVSIPVIMQSPGAAAPPRKCGHGARCWCKVPSCNRRRASRPPHAMPPDPFPCYLFPMGSRPPPFPASVRIAKNTLLLERHWPCVTRA